MLFVVIASALVVLVAGQRRACGDADLLVRHVSSGEFVRPWRANRPSAALGGLHLQAETHHLGRFRIVPSHESGLFEIMHVGSWKIFQPKFLPASNDSEVIMRPKRSEQALFYYDASEQVIVHGRTGLYLMPKGGGRTTQTLRSAASDASRYEFLVAADMQPCMPIMVEQCNGNNNSNG